MTEETRIQSETSGQHNVADEQHVAGEQVTTSDALRGRYRTLFISDVHLGTANCQAGELVKFLARVEADTMYLVGDIVDFWKIKRKAYWPQSHNDVLQMFLKKARAGTRLVLIPGNHDDSLRAYCGQNFGAVELRLNDVYELADGRRMLIMHGDEFDVVVRYAKWLAYLGDRAYTLAMWVNTRLNWMRRSAGLGYWSLSSYLKQKVKQAVNFIGEFESNLAAEAERRGADGVICGHIHHAAMRNIGSVLYVNTGDWVESCTAVGETSSGELEIIRWFDFTGEAEAGTAVVSGLRQAA